MPIQAPVDFEKAKTGYDSLIESIGNALRPSESDGGPMNFGFDPEFTKQVAKALIPDPSDPNNIIPTAGMGTGIITSNARREVSESLVDRAKWLLTNTRGRDQIMDMASLKRANKNIGKAFDILEAGSHENVFSPVASVKYNQSPYFGEYIPKINTIELGGCLGLKEANPYLALNTMLHEGVHGISRTGGAPVSEIGNPYTLKQEIYDLLSRDNELHNPKYKNIQGFYYRNPEEVMARGVAHEGLTKLFPTKTAEELYGNYSFPKAGSYPEEFIPNFQRIADWMLRK